MVSLDKRNAAHRRSSDWHRHPAALPSDILVVAAVNCRRIQSQFKDQISSIIAATPTDSEDERYNLQHSRSRRLMLEMLTPMIQNGLRDWYITWEREVTQSFAALHQPHLDQTLRMMRIWRHSIQLHLCSLALSESVRDRPSGARNGLASDPEKAALEVTALWPVVAGATGILTEFALLTPDRLRSAPGTYLVRP